MQCCSIKLDGHQCTVRILQGTRCKKHEDKFQMTGPNATRHNELKLIHKRYKKEILERYGTHRNINLYGAENRTEDIRYRTAEHALITSIIELGQQRDDDPYDERRRQHVERMREAAARVRAQNMLMRAAVVLHNAQPQQQVAQRELEAIANDKQNVHTTVVVSAVKQMMTKVLEIPVPIEYRTETMKTLTEVIDQCQPPLKAVWQMSAKYCNPSEDIYDMGPGIYAKVLNAVWQFIKTSEHSEDLKKILVTELKDSVAMCAQGNLSRICNVLTGYMEGLDVRSDREILGDKIAQLMEMDDIVQRIVHARAILHNAHIPEAEWAPWLEALE